ncbi:hypothetical protein L596_016668 [Steinernema carpocapsae]|uniref:Uncharacterized protein n=1 Tax=Steinernema carpocapsae TaxID=34508 RepID=A0A4U5NK03_STECR|nr:hypothetical protein L596_016668 [Steinernema carpocapsae]
MNTDPFLKYAKNVKPMEDKSEDDDVEGEDEARWTSRGWASLEIYATVRRMSDGSWRYEFSIYENRRRQALEMTVEDLSQNPSVSISYIEIQGTDYRRGGKLQLLSQSIEFYVFGPQLDTFTPLKISFVTFMELLRSKSTSGVKELQISGDFDESTQAEIVESAAQIKAAKLSIVDYKPAFDSILENALRTDPILKECCISDDYSRHTVWTPATMAVLKSQFLNTKKIPNMVIKNADSPFTFDLFKVIFYVLMKMEVSMSSDSAQARALYSFRSCTPRLSYQQEDSKIFTAFFVEDAKEQLKNFWPQLRVEPGTADYKWGKIDKIEANRKIVRLIELIIRVPERMDSDGSLDSQSMDQSEDQSEINNTPCWYIGLKQFFIDCEEEEQKDDCSKEERKE